MIIAEAALSALIPIAANHQENGESGDSLSESDDDMSTSCRVPPIMERLKSPTLGVSR